MRDPAPGRSPSRRTARAGPRQAVAAAREPSRRSPTTLPSGRRNRGSPPSSPSSIDDPALVDVAVMAPAQQQEVVERGLAAARPVLDVVRVDVTIVRTSGEPAAAIASPECPIDGRRYRPRLAPDRDGLAGALDQRHDRRIAGDSPGRLAHRPPPPTPIVAPPPSSAPRRLRQPVEIDVDDDLVALAAGRRRRALGEQRFGEHAEPVGAVGPRASGPSRRSASRAASTALISNSPSSAGSDARDPEHPVVLPAQIQMASLERELSRRSRALGARPRRRSRAALRWRARRARAAPPRARALPPGSAPAPSSS